MNDINELVLDIKKELYDNPSIKEYLRLKTLIENDKDLIKLNKELKSHQRIMCENINNDEIYLKEKEIYESLKAKMDANPLLVNFNALREEVSQILNEIKDAIK